MSLSQQLRSPDPAQRQVAMATVASRGVADAEELEALAENLGHERKALQRSAAHTFAALNAQSAAVRTVLMGRLHAATPRLRWGAAYSLSLLGAPTTQLLPVLLESLGGSDGDVRWAAADILVRLRGDVSLVDKLCALLREGNPPQRKMAAYCLRDLDARTPDVERALYAALADPDAAVRLAALSGLPRLCTDRAMAAQYVLARFDDANVGVRRAAAAILGPLGDCSEGVVRALRTAAATTDLSLQRAAQRSLRLLVHDA